MALVDEKYMLLTTFRRDGTAVKTPVWVVGLDDETFGFWTSSGSGKAKRLAHTDRVTVQPCNARGQVKQGAPVVDATARLVAGTELESIADKVRAKYGVMTKFTHLLNTVGGVFKGKRIPYGDRGVVVTPVTPA
jgi:PPOX class probable F420-dependent enzyme